MAHHPVDYYTGTSIKYVTLFFPCIPISVNSDHTHGIPVHSVVALSISIIRCPTPETKILRVSNHTIATATPDGMSLIPVPTPSYD